MAGPCHRPVRPLQSASRAAARRTRHVRSGPPHPSLAQVGAAQSRGAEPPLAPAERQGGRLDRGGAAKPQKPPRPSQASLDAIARTRPEQRAMPHALRAPWRTFGRPAPWAAERSILVGLAGDSQAEDEGAQRAHVHPGRGRRLGVRLKLWQRAGLRPGARACALTKRRLPLFPLSPSAPFPCAECILLSRLSCESSLSGSSDRATIDNACLRALACGPCASVTLIQYFRTREHGYRSEPT